MYIHTACAPQSYGGRRRASHACTLHVHLGRMGVAMDFRLTLHFYGHSFSATQSTPRRGQSL